MTHKSARILEMVAGLEGRGWDARYLGYFQCFNEGRFYEAHDVLEDLWLEKRGTPLNFFYKALIQFAGAFVHFQKGRFGPCCALLKLSSGYLRQYPSEFEGLRLAEVLTLSQEWLKAVEKHMESGGGIPSAPPALRMPGPKPV